MSTHSCTAPPSRGVSTKRSNAESATSAIGSTGESKRRTRHSITFLAKLKSGRLRRDPETPRGDTCTHQNRCAADERTAQACAEQYTEQAASAAELESDQEGRRVQGAEMRDAGCSPGCRLHDGVGKGTSRYRLRRVARQETDTAKSDPWTPSKLPARNMSLTAFSFRRPVTAPALHFTSTPGPPLLARPATLDPSAQTCSSLPSSYLLLASISATTRPPLALLPFLKTSARYSICSLTLEKLQEFLVV